MRTAGLVWLAFAAALEAAPVVREVYPHGAQRGRTVKITLRGTGLAAGARLQTTLPANISRLAPPKDAREPDSELPFLVEIRPDTPVGLYPLRLLGADGISNVVLFSVGDFPESEEIESQNPKKTNGTLSDAQPLSSPVILNGYLTAADIDVYSFTAKAGDKLVFEIEARRAGSAVDAAFEILDSTGRLVARNDDGIGAGSDPRLEVSFAKAGPHYIQVHDSRYSEQAPNFYRLRIGSFAYAEGLFPLGWRRGEAVEVTLFGGNLAQPVKVALDGGAKSRHVPIAPPGSVTLPFMFVLGDEPERIEPDAGGPHELAEGVVFNGRIARPGEVDRYTMAVKPGEHWVFELEAASLETSQLDALLTVFDAAGKKLAARDDVGSTDPALPFLAPDGAISVTLTVEDLLGRGGPGFGYRLRARRQPADFTLELVTPFVNVPAGGTSQVVVAMQRRGYDGPVRLTIPGLPPGFRVGGGTVPSEAAAQNFNNDNAGYRTARSVLTITAPEDASGDPIELSVVGTAETPGGQIVRTAGGPGMVVAVRGTRQRAFAAPWLDLGLPMAVFGRQPVSLEVPVELVRVAQGFEYQLNYRVRRASGARTVGRVRNQVSGGVGNLRILQGPPAKNPDAGSILVNTNFATPVSSFDMIVETTAEGPDGRPFTVTAPAVTIEIVQGFQVLLEARSIEISPGGRLEVRGSIHREPTFEGGLVQLRLEDLPDLVKCAGVDVAAGQPDFAIHCEAAPGAPAGVHQIRLSAAAPDTGRAVKDTYKIPDLDLRLAVAGNRNAAR